MKSIKNLLFGIILLCPVFIFSNTIKVPTEFSTIQEAINAAQNGDTILVSDGIYDGDINFNGFAADSVIIKSESGPDNCIIDCQNESFSIGFIFNSSDCKSTIDGFTIKNATMGIWAYANSVPTIKNNVIDSCGVGINCGSDANPNITSNTIRNCGGFSEGGGIYVSWSSPKINDNVIINNYSSKGGGIYCKNSTPSIIDNTIEDNSGGGIYCIDSNVEIEYNTIRNNINEGENTTSSLGGGIYINNTPAEIVLNDIRNNSAAKGGGIYCIDASPSIRQNRIFENNGGGIYCDNASPTIIWNEIFLNNADQGSGVIMSCEYDKYQRPDECYVGSSLKGAGISMEGNSYPDILYNLIHNNLAFHTGGIFCGESSSAYIINNHILENKSYAGGAVYVENSWSRIINNIIAYTEISSGVTERLTRWYKDDLFIKYTYESAKLDYVTYYFGFINNGPPGDVQITGCTGLNTSVWAETGELFWVEAPSDVDQYGNGGGFRATISLDTSSFGFDIKRKYNFMSHGCNVILQPQITSFGTSQEGFAGAGIIAINENNMPEISYNDFYENSGGSLSFIDSIRSKSATMFDIIGINGNILADPLLDTFTYEILHGSPCIDAGIPDVSGLGLYTLDYNGNPRIFDGDDDGVDVIDIGAFEIQSVFMESEEYISICQGKEYEGWTETGDYQRTLTASTGGDSIVITHLTVNPIYEFEEHVSICEGEYYLGFGETGEYRREFETVNGCDSIVVTHLTANPIYESEENISICEGENYLGLTEEGEHRREFESVFGCDSVVITYLTVNLNYESEENISICEGENYLGITEAGEHRREFETVNGCDSVVVTHLTVNPTYEVEEEVSICEGDNYLGLTEEGEHRREFEIVNGCDSVVITNLTVNPIYEIEEDTSICEGEDYLGITEAGEHRREFETVNGCDSIIITNLTFYAPFKPTFTNYSDTLTSDVEYENYQWYDSDGKIIDATNQKFLIEKSSVYYLEATKENGCTYSSDARTVYLTSIDNFKTGGFNYSIMPNPNTGVFRFKIDSNPPGKFEIQFINVLGQVIETRNINNSSVNQIEQFDVSHLSKGIYHFVITTDKFRESRKIVIQ